MSQKAQGEEVKERECTVRETLSVVKRTTIENLGLILGLICIKARGGKHWGGRDRRTAGFAG